MWIKSALWTIATLMAVSDMTQQQRHYPWTIGNSIRLRDGSSARDGRVEVRIDGIWRSVCDKGWDDSDAAVVCSMLGYSRESAVAKEGGVFPSGSGPFIIKNVQCRGTEELFNQCRYQLSSLRQTWRARSRRPNWRRGRWGWNRPGQRRNSCSHIDDAGVICSLEKGHFRSCGSADILFIMDASGSVGQSNFRMMKNFVKNIIPSFNSTNTRFSVITYGTHVNSQFKFNDNLSESMTVSRVNKISYLSGRSTNTYKALQYARQKSFVPGKNNVAKIAILLTDGRSDNPSRTSTEAYFLRNEGVRIFAIGIGHVPNMRELKSVASDPGNEHVFTVRTFTDLSRIQDAVYRRACEATVNGGFTEWSTWSMCSATCNRGTKSRTRTCTNPVPSKNGKNCTGEYQQLSLCQEQLCIAGGRFPLWSKWSQCSKSCGGGTKQRTSICIINYQIKGRVCGGRTPQTDYCNTEPCPIDGGWTSWSSWTKCSVTCGEGMKQKFRTCSNPPPSHGGTKCYGNTTKTSSCVSDQPCPVDGEYSNWESWSQCSTSCGNGKRERYRICDNPKPAFGGRNCTGTNQQEEVCQSGPCPVDGGFSKWSNWSPCSATCGDGQSRRERLCTDPAPAFGGRNCTGTFYENRLCGQSPCPYSEWSDWSQCSKSCGMGFSSRERICNDPPSANGDSHCQGQSYESKSCQKRFCPVNGEFSSWSSWSQCSVSCGGGVSQRNRSCSNPKPAHGGLQCIGNPIENRKCSNNLCPIDGKFSSWEEWSPCSVSCGGGTSQRQRTCSNPKPDNGGRNCTGSYSERKSCSTSPCPVNGMFNMWGDWSQCSKSCGGGVSFRQRTCSNPTPAYGGKNCTGSYSESRTCFPNPCPINGYFATWGEWSHCSTSCGGGTSTRYRSCSNPTPAYGGKNCTGRYTESNSCFSNPCPVDGNFTTWGKWSQCSKSCGGGVSIRQRTCSNPVPAYGGNNCTGSYSENKTCSSKQCPINGKFTSWGKWSQCSTSCGGGMSIRYRTCSNPPPAYGGKNCTKNSSEKRTCADVPCPINGNFSIWGEWTQCSKSCGGGLSTRERTCSNPAPAYNGDNCTGSFAERKICSINSCPINGNFTTWGEWTQCSKSCGGGTSIRRRTCTNPEPAYGGRNCTGHYFENQACFLKPCPINGNFNTWNKWSQCSTSCGGGVSARYRTCSNPAPAYGGKNCTGSDSEHRSCSSNPCPVDGNFTTWGKWAQCSKICGEGVSIRQRTCSNPSPAFGGRNCTGSYSESKPCFSKPCPVNGNFTTWGEWSQCSTSCGVGTTMRYRTCSNPSPSHGGKNCTGSFSASKICSFIPCPINGNFTAWSEWAQCSTSCGGGTTTRFRTCSNPAAAYGGKNCTGSYSESKTCSFKPCPINGNFNAWSKWSQCSTSCGGGTSIRQRTCSNPAPAYGGNNCTGSYSESKPCSSKPCPVNGNFTSWGKWSRCSTSCGGGTSTRQRTCSNPAPAYGGNNCTGSFSENKPCAVDPCPVNGNFTSWGEWSTCSKSCGNGSSFRKRTCSNPAPEYGGANCTGSYSESRACFTNVCPPRYSQWEEWSQCTKTCGGGRKARNRTCTVDSGQECPGPLTETISCINDQCPICATGQFTCADKKTCIALEYKCDDIPDCPDESDESDSVCKRDKVEPT